MSRLSQKLFFRLIIMANSEPDSNYKEQKTDTVMRVVKTTTANVNGLIEPSHLHSFSARTSFLKYLCHNMKHFTVNCRLSFYNIL